MEMELLKSKFNHTVSFCYVIGNNDILVPFWGANFNFPYRTWYFLLPRVFAIDIVPLEYENYIFAN